MKSLIFVKQFLPWKRKYGQFCIEVMIVQKFTVRTEEWSTKLAETLLLCCILLQVVDLY